ncbi:MAG: polysaccharide deacetylase family protein [Proteobacteria bacterium]|nr:polysaccharide deacetylase family protein [Pseudomonadota bacterium]
MELARGSDPQPAVEHRGSAEIQRKHRDAHDHLQTLKRNRDDESIEWLSMTDNAFPGAGGERHGAQPGHGHDRRSGMAQASLPVLMYHGIHADASSRGRYEPVYSVTAQAFSAQIDWLLAQGYRSVRLDDLCGDDARGGKRVVITFDDGDVSNFEVALPLLRERGFVAEFFVTSDFIGTDGMLTSADVRALSAAGMGVQSHGRTHRYLEDLAPGDLDEELSFSRQVLEQVTGKAVDALALPGGRGGERERLVAQRLGYRYLLNSEPGPNRGWHADSYLQRLAVTRGMGMKEFAGMVTWSGIGPRMARMRYHALRLPKRMLGNRRYEQLRARMFGP